MNKSSIIEKHSLNINGILFLNDNEIVLNLNDEVKEVKLIDLLKSFNECAVEINIVHQSNIDI